MLYLYSYNMCVCVFFFPFFGEAWFSISGMECQPPPFKKKHKAIKQEEYDELYI